MPNHKHPKSEGALFLNEKKQENHPDFRGNVVVTSAQLKELIDMAKRFRENPENEKLQPKLQIAAWNRVAKDTGRNINIFQQRPTTPRRSSRLRRRRKMNMPKRCSMTMIINA